MFSVIFEVEPWSDKWDAYLDSAKMLRPKLEQVDGFVDNLRYKSLGREDGSCRCRIGATKKSVVRWRTRMRHHEAQEKGRGDILRDYHLRVGQLTEDTRAARGVRAPRTAPRRDRGRRCHDGHAHRCQEAGQSTRELRTGGRGQGPGSGSRGRGTRWLGCLRCGADAGRSDPADVLERAKPGQGLRGEGEASGRREASPGSRGARLRHVRPTRSAPILPGCHSSARVKEPAGLLR